MVPVCKEGFIKPMDIEDPNQQEDVFLAAQLSRIVGRALENRAFGILQKKLNEPKIDKTPEEAKETVFQLGRTLLQFRWRIAWWEVSGHGGVNDTISKQRYIQRLQQLAMVLYFYYCNAKSRLPYHVASQGLQGIKSLYPGAAPFLDDFPQENTIPGWEAWLEQGKKLVRKAQAERSTVTGNPYPEHIAFAVV